MASRSVCLWERMKPAKQQKAIQAQRKFDEIAPQVDDFERWAQQFSGELETVLPEVKGIESAKSYREKKAKPLLAKVIDVLKALYREFIALRSRYFSLEKKYHQVMNERNRLGNALSNMEIESKGLRKDAVDFQRVKRILGPKEVERAIQLDKQSHINNYNHER